VSTRDPYEVLGVPRTATTRQIRAAYVDRARRAHPDLVGQRGTDVMRALNDAWEVLKDPSRRSELDATASSARREAAGARAADEHGHGRARGPVGGTKPFWTGAAGPPPGRPQGPVVDFGIFAGWSLGEIARRDIDYIEWLDRSPIGRQYRDEIDLILRKAGRRKSAGAEAQERRGLFRRR
jgi:curved DNA-binding protein CbpA